jgi:hypothetical protein
MIEDTDRAYIAGFLDGEGGVYLQHEATRVCIKIYQKDRTILDWIASTTGMGNVSQNCRGIHTLSISRMADVVSFVQVVYPYVRRNKLRLKLAYHIAKTRTGGNARLHLVSRFKVGQ